MREPFALTPDEIHEFGINVVLNDIQKNGYSITSVTSDRNSNPQIVARKNGQLVHIIVRTAVYPRKGVIESFELGLQILEYAHSKDAVCFFASVGIANAFGSTDLEMSIANRGASYLVSYSGIEPLTPVKVRMTTSSNSTLATYDRGGQIAGSVRKEADGRYTIIANNA